MIRLAIENVQSYPRPPLLERVTVPLRLVVDQQTVALTTLGWRVCETHHPPTYYFPPADIAPGWLVPGKGLSHCEWKGDAAYFDLVGNGQTVHRAGWAYPSPSQAFWPIAGHVAFYVSDRVRGYVGELAALAQPGGFYGGWVTSNLTGRIKGTPGTEGW